MMMNIIEILVILTIFSGLIYSFAKHLKLVRTPPNFVNSDSGKKTNIILISMSTALFGLILFYSLNILTGLGFISNSFLSSNVTALGAFISLIIYVILRFNLPTKNSEFTNL